MEVHSKGAILDVEGVIDQGVYTVEQCCFCGVVQLALVIGATALPHLTQYGVAWLYHGCGMQCTLRQCQ